MLPLPGPRPRAFEFFRPLLHAGDWFQTEDGPRCLLFDVDASNHFHSYVLTDVPQGEDKKNIWCWKDEVTNPSSVNDLRYPMIPAPKTISRDLQQKLSNRREDGDLFPYAGMPSRDKDSAPPEVKALYGRRILASLPSTRADREDDCEIVSGSGTKRIVAAHLFEDGHTVLLMERGPGKSLVYHVRTMDDPSFNAANAAVALPLEERRRQLYGAPAKESGSLVPAPKIPSNLPARMPETTSLRVEAGRGR